MYHPALAAMQGRLTRTAGGQIAISMTPRPGDMVAVAVVRCARRSVGEGMIADTHARAL